MAEDGKRTPRTSIVHHDDHEGGLVIDTYTGEIKTDNHDRPDWAAGLIIAHPGERVSYYKTRLGPEVAAAFETPDLINFADLEWTFVTEDQQAITMAADADHRMTNLAQLCGFARLDNLDETQTYGPGNVLAEVEIGMQTGRDEGELSALRFAQDKQEFGALVEREKRAANG